MLKNIIKFALFLLTLSTLTKAFPNDVNISKWEVFTDMKIVTSVAIINNKYVFCATSGGLFLIDNSNGSILRKYTNIDGLLFNDLTSLIVDNQNRLWIGASDGSICIYDFFNETWRYIYDIKNSTENNKSINYFILSGNNIFVATGYGIQKISATLFSFVDAPYYQFGTLTAKSRVNILSIYNNLIFAGTAQGIAYASLINSNLNDPASWTIYNTQPMNVNTITLESAGGKLFAGSEGGFVYFDGTNWNSYPNVNVNTKYTRYIKSIGSTLYFISNTSANYGSIYSADLNNLPVINTYLISGNLLTLASDNQNLIVGTSEQGAYIKKSSGYDYVFPNCPNRIFFNQVTYDDNGNIWAAAGIADGGFYKYDGTTWFTYNTDIYPQLGPSNLFKKVIPNGNSIWGIGYGGGAILITGSNIINYNHTNSNLPGILNYPFFVALSSGAVDSRSRIWLINYESNSGASLYAYKGDSVFLKYDNPGIISAGGFTRFTNISIDNYNTKWITCANPAGLYFFNENGTDTVFSDDIYGFYPANDLAVSEITDVVIEKNGEVWFSSDNGVFIINNPLAAIQNPANKPTPVKLGIISGNLREPFTENCRCIYSDILNEKWIGTQTNGVFHLSEDGSTLLEEFNMSNSPILYNFINSVSVSRKTGKAYFGTDKGLFVYQTNAIEPVENFDKIICMPNPYLIPSTVDLKIDGLVEGSTVKILTLNGEVINEFDSPGGRIATWNGLNKKGVLVPSGIYIIVAFNKDASKIGKGKVAIVRK